MGRFDVTEDCLHDDDLCLRENSNAGHAMTWDFSALILIATLAAGLVVAVDAILRRRTPQQESTKKESRLVEYSRSLFPVLLVVAVLRSFVFEPFRIPSGSMMPGLVDGDFIFVEKFSYGLRMPLLNSEIVPIGEPQRGDVIVFRSPANPSINLIKRLVGLPGDHVVVRDNRLFINDVVIPLKPDGLYPAGYRSADAKLGLEQFGSADHVVMFASAGYAVDFEGVVPADHYFFMGDNRNDSEDSRFAKVGFVPRDNLIGHAMGIWMNWRIPGWPAWERVGLAIK
jgi:signal peptidase I